MKLKCRLFVLACLLAVALIVSTAVNVMSLMVSLSEDRHDLLVHRRGVLPSASSSDSSSDNNNIRLDAILEERLHRLRQKEEEIREKYDLRGPAAAAAAAAAVGVKVKAIPEPPLRAGLLESLALAGTGTGTGNGANGGVMGEAEMMQMVLEDSRLRNDGTVNNIVHLGKLLEEYKRKTSGVNINSNTSNEKPSMVARSANGPAKADIIRPANNDRAGSAARDATVKIPSKTLDYLSKLVEDGQKMHKMRSRRTQKAFKMHIHTGSDLKPWQRWHNEITQFSLYDQEGATVDELVRDLSELPITGLRTLPDYGTQIKLVFMLADGSQALFKPMRMKRDATVLPDHFYFDEFERHTAEIAAFHLDRLLEFGHVPPVAGRVVNITFDIKPYATRDLRRTIYKSPAGNICFYGKCDYYCDSGHPVCGSPALVEGSMAAWLPTSKGTGKKSWENPWGRSYSKFELAEWEYDEHYCSKIRRTEPYSSGRRLLDVIDIGVFDFFTGNQDRHHYHSFKMFGNLTFPLLYDNGRGFGRLYDDLTILKPLTQCCQLRYSTLSKLVTLARGPRHLSDVMRDSLAGDALTRAEHGPVLTEAHLDALDRRVRIVINSVQDCIARHGAAKVILDDGF